MPSFLPHPSSSFFFFFFVPLLVYIDGVVYEGDYYVDETSTASSCDDPSIGVADDGRLDGPADDTDVWSAYRATWQAVHELPTATTPEEFALKWAADGQPVVVRGGAVGWPALKLWTLPLLRERFGAEVSNREPAAGEVMFDADGIPIDLFNDHDVEDEGLHWEYVTSTASRLLIPFFCSSLFLFSFFFSFFFFFQRLLTAGRTIRVTLPGMHRNFLGWSETKPYRRFSSKSMAECRFLQQRLPVVRSTCSCPKDSSKVRRA